jgi:DNA-directed RNA polymerase subunit RPC12/RpoP
MTTCEITVPIRTIGALQFQPSGVTCMRCGEEFTSNARGRGFTEQTCGCGLVYRVETLSVDSVACVHDLAPANDSRFRAPPLP